jgi:nitrite reductase/ring-hydroxylating ferredoxin subunit
MNSDVELHTGLDFDQIMVTAPDLGEVILVHTGSAEKRTLHAWRNSCPHIGVGLDYGDGNCLLEPGVLICSMHGARFEADTGVCFVGPCAGQGLTAVPIRIDGERILLEEAP